MSFFTKVKRKILHKWPLSEKQKKRKILQEELFSPGCRGIYGATGKNADAFYLPAWERLFLLLTSFHINGMRGDFYEFGVLSGYSAHLFSKLIVQFGFNDSHLHLFDSFEGLPPPTEDDKGTIECKEAIWTAGSMATASGLEIVLEKELKKILGEGRLHLVKGFFDKTLPIYFSKSQKKKALLVHVDCDLYSSSKEVLSQMFRHNLMQEGTIVICDDWMSGRGNPEAGQKKAVKDVLEENPGWQFEPYLNYGLGSQAFVLHDIPKQLEELDLGCSESSRD